MVDLKLPDAVIDELEAHVLGGLRLSEQARAEILSSIRHAKGDCECGRET